MIELFGGMVEENIKKIQSLEETVSNLKDYQTIFDRLPLPAIILNSDLEFINSNASWNSLRNSLKKKTPKKTPSFIELFTAYFDLNPETQSKLHKGLSGLSNTKQASFSLEIKSSINNVEKFWLVNCHDLRIESKGIVVLLVDITPQISNHLKDSSKKTVNKPIEDTNLNNRDEANVKKAHDHFETQTHITAKHFGLESLTESNPDFFQELVGRFDELVNESLQLQMYKENTNFSLSISMLANDLGSINAEPRDVIDIYLSAIRTKSQTTGPKKFSYYNSEARLVVLELMGHLVSFYRNYSFGLGRKLH